MYFESFPVVQFASVKGGEPKIVTNLLRRVAMRSQIKENTLVFDTYDVQEGETPEMIAHKLYGDSELHWVILLLNDITDRFHGWPMSEAQFLKFVNDKYDNVDAIHHYEISQSSGDTSKKINIGTSNSDYPTATAITNFEHEQEQQDIKRKIRLLDPSYLDDFVEEFKLLIRESTI